MDGKTGRDNKKKKFTKNYKGQEIVESYDYQRPENTQYTEEESLYVINVQPIN